jgi:hypothetical protein
LLNSNKETINKHNPIKAWPTSSTRTRLNFHINAKLIMAAKHPNSVAKFEIILLEYIMKMLVPVY